MILGISPDTVAAQAKFKKKFELPFTLLADADHAVAEQYGVWQEKMNYGKTYMGVVRTTFLIGKRRPRHARVREGDAEGPCRRPKVGGALDRPTGSDPDSRFRFPTLGRRTVGALAPGAQTARA